MPRLFSRGMGRIMHIAKHLACIFTFGSALVVSACGSSSGAGPKITSVTLTQSPNTVLAYSLEVKTDETTTVSVKVTPPDTTEQSWTVTSTESGADNHLIIAGMRAHREYSLEITARDDSGQSASDSKSITTAALPSGMPKMQVPTHDSSKMSPGFTLFGVFSWLTTGAPAPQGWLIALDNDGNVVWYLQTDNRPEDVRVLPDGNVGYSYEGTVDGYTEVDALGNPVPNKAWVADGLTGKTAPDGTTGVKIESMHHAVFPLPNGDFLTLSSELKATGSANCASSTQNFVGDDIVEFKPDGTVVKSVSEFDILDPCRQRTADQVTEDYGDGFWNAYYGGITTQDWTHSNTVFYDQASGLAVVSVRHQDLLIGMHWTPGGGGNTGTVAWLFGDEENPGDFDKYPHFASAGTPFDWTYHQHAAVVLSNGDLMMFDNGNLRPGTNFTGGTAALPYSRVVEFQIDTAAMTAKQVWQWKAPDPYRSGGFMYCPFIGNVNELDNGDMLADFGGGVEPPSDSIAAPTERKFARIVELAEPGDSIVFDVRVTDPAQTNFTGYSVYRARRITGFLR
jgi:arylsulfate sulfotransferase